MTFEAALYKLSEDFNTAFIHPYGRTPDNDDELKEKFSAEISFQMGQCFPKAKKESGESVEAETENQIPQKSNGVPDTETDETSNSETDEPSPNKKVLELLENFSNFPKEFRSQIVQGKFGLRMTRSILCSTRGSGSPSLFSVV
eukprot:GHVP01058251.1.p1 GENE.GHVP01058251.1~~GHVP01058251.1.p1  ORF type:complete len:144 (+),score=22.84 GHVP01058251.1:68-499(+)